MTKQTLIDNTNLVLAALNATDYKEQVLPGLNQVLVSLLEQLNNPLIIQE